MTKKCLFCAADDVSDDDWKMLVETDTRKIKRRWIPRVWAYIYSGDISQTGFIMVRLSNFMVFFLTSGIVFAYNLYVMGLFESYVRIDKIPLRMKIVAVMSVVGMLMSIISQFTDLFMPLLTSSNILMFIISIAL